LPLSELPAIGNLFRNSSCGMLHEILGGSLEYFQAEEHNLMIWYFLQVFVLT